MGKFRKKPVVIEAWKFEPKKRGFFHDMPQWLEKAYEDEKVSNVGRDVRSSRLQINTLEGEMFADQGDWIIQGVKGEIYPCKPDIFAATYDPV